MLKNLYYQVIVNFKNIMKENKSRINRRDFFKALGAAGLAPYLATNITKAEFNEPGFSGGQEQALLPQIPRRKLGKTGIEIPELSIGVMYNAIDKQAVLIISAILIVS